MIGGTLAVVTAEIGATDHLLLGVKQYGPDAGRLVLPGGKNDYQIMPGGINPPTLIAHEHPHYAVLREVREETGIDLPLDATYQLGHLLVSMATEDNGFNAIDADFAINIYRSFLRRYSELPALRACDELRPQWVPVKAIDYDLLQEDVRIWLPHMLRMTGHPSSIYGRASYTRAHHDLGKHALTDYWFSMHHAADEQRIDLQSSA